MQITSMDNPSFKEAARELETDDHPERLRKLAKPAPQSGQKVWG